MQFKLRTLLMSMAGIPIVLVLGPALLNWAVGFDTEMQRSFRELEYDQSLESAIHVLGEHYEHCLLYTSPSPRDRQKSRMPSSA